MYQFSSAWLALLLDASLKSLLLAAVTGAALLVLKVRDSNLRHRAYTAMLAGMLALPALTLILPKFGLPNWYPALLDPYAAWRSASAQLAFRSAEPSPRAEPVASLTPTELTEGMDWATDDDSDGTGLAWSADSHAKEPLSAGGGRPAEAEGRSSDAVSELTSGPSLAVLVAQRFAVWLPVLVAAYFLVSCLLAVRLVSGLVRIRGMFRKARPVSLDCLKDRIEADAASLRQDGRSPIDDTLAETRSFAVLESSLILNPVTVGWFRPRIVLPADWWRWTGQQLDSVLRHEVAHIRRGDYLVNLLSLLNCCLYWFHPLAWHLSARLRALSELACDDAVIAVVGTRVQYARLLVGLVEAASRRRNCPLKAAAPSMAWSANVDARVTAILDSARPLARDLGPRRAAQLIAACSAALLGVAVLGPAQREAGPGLARPTVAGNNGSADGLATASGRASAVPRDQAVSDDPGSPVQALSEVGKASTAAGATRGDAAVLPTAMPRDGRANETLLLPVAKTERTANPAVSPAGGGGADGSLVVEDFEDGNLDEWIVDEGAYLDASTIPEVFEIVDDAGSTGLHLKGQVLTTIYLKDRQFEDFSFEVTLRKIAGSQTGVVVRDQWCVYLDTAGFLSLKGDGSPLQPGGQFTSGHRVEGPCRLRVVCAGPLLHAFVGGERVFTYRVPPGEGRVGFYAHQGEAWYDDVRIDTHTNPDSYLLVEPETPDDCLVFPPEERVGLKFRVSNFSQTARRIAVTARVETWSGKRVKEPLSSEVLAEAGGQGLAEFDMGTLPAGFYRLNLRAECEGQIIAGSDDLPLAIQRRGSNDYQAPIFPLGVYYRYQHSSVPVYRNTYAHVAARILRDHSFNAVVADSTFDAKTIAIFQSYGVSTITRYERWLEQPAVIASFVGCKPSGSDLDALRVKCQELRAKTTKPIVTSLATDAIGIGGVDDALSIWDDLSPQLRGLVWNGPGGGDDQAGELLLSAALKTAESASATPYWLSIDPFADQVRSAAGSVTDPARVRSVLHLALAHGADGLLFWALQSNHAKTCFLDQKSLQPVDSAFQAAAEVAAAIGQHAELIRSLVPLEWDIACESPAVVAVPRQSDSDSSAYVYVVSLDATRAISTKLVLPVDRGAVAGARDVFTGRSFNMEQADPRHVRVPLTLEPGEGQLLLVY